MIPIDPQRNLISDRGILHWAQSVYRAMFAAMSFGQPDGTNAAGVYNQFKQDNMDGVLIRIGAGETYDWPGAGVGVAINHGLHRQPIGFIVCDIDASGSIYRSSTPPTEDIIELACTNATANATVYIF